MFTRRHRFGLIVLAANAALAVTTSATDLMDIVKAYGGTSALAKGNSLYIDSTVCSTSTQIPESRRCYRSLTYRKDDWTGRFEEIRGTQRFIFLVHRDSAEYFVDGSWLMRFVSGPAGRGGVSLSAPMVSELHSALQSGAWSTLINAIATDPLIQASVTREGKPADVVYRVIEDNTNFYYFDPQTHLCIERSFSTPQTGQMTFAYSDYRSASGLPLPYRIDVFRGRDKQPSAFETIQRVAIHQNFPDELFQPLERVPLWFAPAVVVVAMVLIVVFILLVVAQRTRTLKEEAQPTASLLGR